MAVSICCAARRRPPPPVCCAAKVLLCVLRPPEPLPTRKALALATKPLRGLRATPWSRFRLMVCIRVHGSSQLSAAACSALDSATKQAVCDRQHCRGRRQDRPSGTLRAPAGLAAGGWMHTHPRELQAARAGTHGSCRAQSTTEGTPPDPQCQTPLCLHAAGGSPVCTGGPAGLVRHCTARPALRQLQTSAHGTGHACLALPCPARQPQPSSHPPGPANMGSLLRGARLGCRSRRNVTPPST